MTEATFYDELAPELDAWQIEELERRILKGRRGPGKSWRHLRPWAPPGVPAYRPTNTLIPPPLRLEVRFS